MKTINLALGALLLASATLVHAGITEVSDDINARIARIKIDRGGSKNRTKKVIRRQARQSRHRSARRRLQHRARQHLRAGPSGHRHIRSSADHRGRAKAMSSWRTTGVK